MEESEEGEKVGLAGLGGEDAGLPVKKRPGMEPTSGKPAVDVVSGDVKVFWMALDVEGDPLPCIGGNFASKVGIVKVHRVNPVRA